MLDQKDRDRHGDVALSALHQMGELAGYRAASESIELALRRLGTVEDCAKVVEFLATDLSDYVTGAVIPIDGGLVRG